MSGARAHLHGVTAHVHGASAGVHGADAGMRDAGASMHGAGAGLHDSGAESHNAGAGLNSAGVGMHGAGAGTYGAGAQVHDARLACTMEVPTQRIDFGVRWQSRFIGSDTALVLVETHTIAPIQSAVAASLCRALQIFRPRQHTIENSSGFQALVSD